jgi:hypothetical protein
VRIGVVDKAARNRSQVAAEHEEAAEEQEVGRKVQGNAVLVIARGQIGA